MLSGDQLDLLREIILLDADAVASHTAALERIELPSLRSPLETFRDEHLHHMHALNTFLVRQGLAEVETRLQVRGGPLANPNPRGTARVEVALTALSGCEHLVGHSYGLLLREDWPPELEALLRCHHAEELHHGLWVTEALRERPWERPRAVLP